jgi:hypothetical protein
MNNEINDIYYNNGHKINLIPVPGLCITCKSYEDEDWEENMLCNLNRFDQKNSVEFICGAYEKI